MASPHAQVGWSVLAIVVWSWVGLGGATDGAAMPGTERVSFRPVTIEHGLSQNSVYAILQDRQGFMWFGTAIGLNRHDGVGFVVYNPRPERADTLSNRFVNALAEDGEGFLWVGTDEGLNRFDHAMGEFRQYPSRADQPNGLSGHRVHCLLVDGRNRLWVGTDQGLDLYDAEADRFTPHPPPVVGAAGAPVRAIAADAACGVWVGVTGFGLFLFSPDTGAWSRPLDGSALSADLTVLSILVDRKGDLWVGTQSDGLAQLDRLSGRLTLHQADRSRPGALSDNTVTCLLQDDGGRLWVGTHDGGLNRFHPDAETFSVYRNDSLDPGTIPHDRIVSLYQDRAGTIWVGTGGGGIGRFRPGDRRFLHFQSNPHNPDTLSGNEVRSFQVDARGTLWVGTDGQGLNRYDPATDRFQHFRHDSRDPRSISHNSVFSIEADPSGDLWLGTHGGLDRFSPGQGVVQSWRHDPADEGSLSHNRIRSLHRDPNGTLWIGTDGGGLNRFDPVSGRFTRFRHDPTRPDSLSHDRVFKVYGDPVESALWVCTFGGGLCRLDLGTGRWRVFSHQPDNPRSLANNYLMSVVRDQRGVVWVGSHGGGMSGLEPGTGEFVNLGEADGLPNDSVYGLAEDADGTLWASTNKGLFRYNPATGQFKVFGVSDGTQADEFNGGAYYVSPSGLLYFGGINGFNVFDPRNIRDNPVPPPVVITDLLLMNRRVAPGERIDGRVILPRSVTSLDRLELTYRDYMVSFEFAALCYVAPATNQHAYMLEGFDRDWVQSGARRFATYTNLPAGEYVFRVRGANNDGVWNLAGAELRIRVTPPFWKTRWFVGLSLLAVGLAVYGVIEQRMRRLKRDKAELERQVAARTRELREVSLRDPLTGLRNRRYLVEVLRDDIRALVSYRKYLISPHVNRRKRTDNAVMGVLLLDLDLFKVVNDQLGHDAGDHLLITLAELLQQSVRADDVVVRFGGEEFLIVLKNTQSDFLPVFAETLRRRIADTPFTAAGHTVRKTCSIGFAQFPFYEDYPDWLSFENTISLADKGLYFAKNHGRNQAVAVTAGPERGPEGPMPIEQLLETGSDGPGLRVRPVPPAEGERGRT